MKHFLLFYDVGPTFSHDVPRFATPTSQRPGPPTIGVS